MGAAKRIRVEPISRADADRAVKRWHYSGKVVQNSQLNLGAFLDGKLLGAMQLGPSLDKRRMVGLVEDTPWNGFLELNRMAFSDALPRNSESRALAVAMRMLRDKAPHVQWVVSFADGTQCGDGTIYRAAGFALTGVSKNKTLWMAPTGEIFADASLKLRGARNRFFRALSVAGKSLGRNLTSKAGCAGTGIFREAGFRPLPGFQLRYLYFLHPTARERLTVPILPYSKIEELGAGMYRGKPSACSRVAGASHSSAVGRSSRPACSRDSAA